jgi:hypothetical protein
MMNLSPISLTLSLLPFPCSLSLSALKAVSSVKLMITSLVPAPSSWPLRLIRLPPRLFAGFLTRTLILLLPRAALPGPLLPPFAFVNLALTPLIPILHQGRGIPHLLMMKVILKSRIFGTAASKRVSSSYW